MNGWIIFGSIVLFLVWLFTRSATVILSYDGKLDIKVKFLFFVIYPAKPGKNKVKKPKKPKNVKSAEAAAENEPDVPESGEGGEEAAGDGGDKKSPGKPVKAAKAKPKKKKSVDLEQIMEYVKSASPPIKKLLKSIRFLNLDISYTAASDDAAKTAIKYGTVCAAVYPLLEWMKCFFTVKVKRVKISADFSSEKDDIRAYCVIKLRISTALGCAVWLLWRIGGTYLKYGKTADTNKQKQKPVKA